MPGETFTPMKEFEGSGVTFGIYSSETAGFRDISELEPFRKLIETVSTETITQILTEIPASTVDIGIFNNPGKAIPEYRIGGTAHGGHPRSKVEIDVNPTSTNWQNAGAKNLKRILRHELFHDARFDQFGFSDTLLEKIISEGLATRYENQNPELDPSLYAQALNSDQLQDYMERLKHVNLNTDPVINHAWLFGSSERGIPRWTGYSIGYALVESYLSKNPGIKPSDLYKIPTAEIAKISFI